MASSHGRSSSVLGSPTQEGPSRTRNRAELGDAARLAKIGGLNIGVEEAQTSLANCMVSGECPREGLGAGADAPIRGREETVATVAGRSNRRVLGGTVNVSAPEHARERNQRARIGRGLRRENDR